MKFSTQIILGLVVIGALGGIYSYDNYSTKKEELKKEVNSRAIYFKSPNVTEFSIKTKMGDFLFARENKKTEWVMKQPKSLDADQDSVENSLAALEQIHVQQEISSTENKVSRPADLKEFGLDAPQLVASVKSTDGNSSLSIGRSIEIGEKTTGTPFSVFALNSLRSRVLVVDNSNISALVEKTFADYRTKRVAHFKFSDVASVHLAFNDASALVEKNGNIWSVVAPEKAEADESFVVKYINTFQSLIAYNVIESADVEKDGLAKFDLAHPAAIVKFSDSQGKVLQEFNLGITKDSVYVRMLDGSVARLKLDSWPDLVPKAAMFENRKFLLGIDSGEVEAVQFKPDLFYVKKDSNWYRQTELGVAPKVTDKPDSNFISFFTNLQFMTANDLVLNSSSGDLIKYGIYSSTNKFSLIFKKSSKVINPVEITVGNRLPLNNKAVYLKRSDSSRVYVVPADWLSQFENLKSATIKNEKKT